MPQRGATHSLKNTVASRVACRAMLVHWWLLLVQVRDCTPGRAVACDQRPSDGMSGYVTRRRPDPRGSSFLCLCWWFCLHRDYQDDGPVVRRGCEWSSNTTWFPGFSAQTCDPRWWRVTRPGVMWYSVSPCVTTRVGWSSGVSCCSPRPFFLGRARIAWYVVGWGPMGL